MHVMVIANARTGDVSSSGQADVVRVDFFDKKNCRTSVTVTEEGVQVTRHALGFTVASICWDYEELLAATEYPPGLTKEDGDVGHERARESGRGGPAPAG